MSTPILTPAYLPNPIYAALDTADKSFALAHGLARRFQPETIPFAGVFEPSAEALADLLQLLIHGEEVWTTLNEDEKIPAVAGLEVVSTLPSLQMRFMGALSSKDDDPSVVSLTREDTEEMLELKARAYPGFFGPRAPELGTFFGVRDSTTDKLIAMGGERLATDLDREISAVCTDPGYTGQGHAARIMKAILHHQAELGVGSILHVAASNGRAISLYEHMGFGRTGYIDFIQLRKK